ncbi:HCP-like protein [Lentithecium fluviatile CBS 122367]|uniref:HCP-like protein n=1 Tax=Lentithecium fluviatile CBS 122367 TaxID=1168545 RepID=A0A6G1J6C5_9PLEO|nr:HCP-like protein [Lentithecium fluviatile CBS 122367]
MSYQQGQPQLGATFVPGGFDDYYMPAPSPEVISPAPQRIMPEVPENMQENIAHLELEANPRSSANAPMSPPAQGFQQPSPFPPRGSSFQSEQAPQARGQGQWPLRQASISSTFKQPPAVQPQTMQQPPSHDYHSFAQSNEVPNFSIFPKLANRPPNVPPSDDEKEAVLENARLPVLNSNDPEMQLAWAQDALAYVDTAQLHEQRIAEIQGARPATPAVEHQLRVDAMNVTSFLADQFHPKAEFMRGMWLEFGKFGLRVDKKEAFRSYTRAAQKGYARAEYRMGMQFEQSNDPIKALQHYKAGSEAGDSASNYRLGMMTLLGQHGQQQDFAKGIHLIRQAAATADENAPQGAYVLGMLQARELPQINVPDTFLPYDEKGARQNIEKAAYLGFAKAQLKMGSAYELCSLGCEFSPILSLHYNALASRQGEPEADMAISKWFLCGNEPDFPKNEELAYQYAQRAAAAGLATAEFAMGYFNEIGMHIPVNLDKAQEWYEKAARNGNKDAEARIESIGMSRTLSKTDHEKVAIKKIRSQHGSMRGQRPARLQKMAAPALPTIDSSPSDYGDSPATTTPGGARLPDRNATTTPYPISDKPPMLGGASAPYERSATAAPYPMDNGPPRMDSRPGLAGGFAPELRAASARPASQAFNINPNVYGPGPGPGPGPNDPYGRGRIPPQGPNMGHLPMRPATSVDNMGRGGGRMPSGGPPGPGGPGGYRQPGGPSAQRPEMRPATTQPSDIGFAAPDNRNKLQKPGPGPLKKQGTLPDIGFVAPLEPRQHTRPSTVQPGQESRTSSRPERPSTAAPGPRPGQGPSPRPGSAGRGSAQHSYPQGSKPGLSPIPSKPATPQPQPSPAKPAPAQAPKPPGPQHATSTPGKGPKTFDEMGIGQAPKDSDCVVM